MQVKKLKKKLWRMPLNKNFDKLIDSKNADMQNINYVGGAGSTTAAQFLQRFIINKTPWAHLDIAGMAFSKYGGALNPGGATVSKQTINGATDSTKAEEGTLRKMYGISIDKNSVHGSDSIENGKNKFFL